MIHTPDKWTPKKAPGLYWLFDSKVNPITEFEGKAETWPDGSGNNRNLSVRPEDHGGADDKRWKLDGDILNSGAQGGNNGNYVTAQWERIERENADVLWFDGNMYIDVPPSVFTNVSANNEITIVAETYGDAEWGLVSNFFFSGVDELVNAGARILGAHLPWSNGSIYFDAGVPAGYDRVQAGQNSNDNRRERVEWMFIKNTNTGLMEIRRNGVAIVTSTNQNRDIGNITKFFIGKWVQGGQHWRGCLNKFEVYSTGFDKHDLWEYLGFSRNEDNSYNIGDLPQTGMGSQDVTGSHVSIVSGSAIECEPGNSWKAYLLPTPYEVTPNTRVEFDFEGIVEGEEHGIGFTNNPSSDINTRMKVWGTQNSPGDNLNDFNDYQLSDGIKNYDLPFGSYFYTDSSQLFNYIFIVNDDDTPAPLASARWYNIRIYEDNPNLNAVQEVRYRFANGSSGDLPLITDQSGNNRDGTIIYDTPPALSFVGGSRGNQALRLNHIEGIGLGDPWTQGNSSGGIAMTMRIKTRGREQTIYNDGGNTRGHHLYIDENGYLVLIGRQSGTHEIFTTIQVADNQWHSIGFTWYTGVMELSVDGVYAGGLYGIPFYTGNGNPGNDASIGPKWSQDTPRPASNDRWDSRSFAGDIEDIRHFNRVMNILEVSSVMALADKTGETWDSRPNLQMGTLISNTPELEQEGTIIAVVTVPTGIIANSFFSNSPGGADARCLLKCDSAGSPNNIGFGYANGTQFVSTHTVDYDQIMVVSWTADSAGDVHIHKNLDGRSTVTPSGSNLLPMSAIGGGFILHKAMSWDVPLEENYQNYVHRKLMEEFGVT